MKKIKKRLKDGETLLGCWLNLGSLITAEIVGNAGFDWVLIDLEHGAGTEKDLLHQLQAIKSTLAGAVVRVESIQRQRIHRVLDLGAEGVMCPRIHNAEEAKKAVKGLHYPPLGKRGMAKMVRATGFGKDFSDYLTHSQENVLGVVQIETAEVLNHLEEIVALDGVDVLFIGPSDLSMELGVFGELDHPLFKDALQATVSAARKAGKATGILIPNPEEFATYHEMGIRMIACGSDATFVSQGANNMMKALKVQQKAQENKKL